MHYDQHALDCVTLEPVRRKCEQRDICEVMLRFQSRRNFTKSLDQVAFGLSHGKTVVGQLFKDLFCFCNASLLMHPDLIFHIPRIFQCWSTYDATVVVAYSTIKSTVHIVRFQFVSGSTHSKVSFACSPIRCFPKVQPPQG